MFGTIIDLDPELGECHVLAGFGDDKNRADLSTSSSRDPVVPLRLVAVARHAAVAVARSRMIVFPLNYSILS